jgi:hypothetical protein
MMREATIIVIFIVPKVIRPGVPSTMPRGFTVFEAAHIRI